MTGQPPVVGIPGEDPAVANHDRRHARSRRSLLLRSPAAIRKLAFGPKISPHFHNASFPETSRKIGPETLFFFLEPRKMACFGKSEASPQAPPISLEPMFSKNFKDLSMVKDLPRLASRIAISSKTLVLPAQCTIEQPTSAGGCAAVAAPVSGTSENSADQPITESAVTRVVVALASILAPVESEAVAAATSSYDSSVAAGVDPQVACLELLESIGGEASIVVRSLKLVNQGVVLYALSELRQSFPPGVDMLTKVPPFSSGVHLTRSHGLTLGALCCAFHPRPAFSLLLVIGRARSDGLAHPHRRLRVLPHPARATRAVCGRLGGHI